MKYEDFTAHNKQEIKDQLNKHNTIYLYGTYGKGKTHFCKHVQYKYARHKVVYRLSAELHRELIKEIQDQKSGNYYIGIIDRMCDCDVLLLDDLGNEHMSEFVHEALSVVIDTRYIEHNKDNPRPMKTIITSNYTLEELYTIWRSKIGDVKAGQLISRLKTFGVIEFKGEQWR